MEWISVKDRLPEPYRDVLVCSSRRLYGLANVTADKEWKAARYLREISHWMPLPEPPEEEGLAEVLEALSDLEAYQKAIAQQLAEEICKEMNLLFSCHMEEIVIRVVKRAVQ